MTTTGVYGAPPLDLVAFSVAAVQYSPLIPDAALLEEARDGSLEAIVVQAPPGTVERRYALAHAIRALASGGQLTALAPKDKGGARLGKELAALGCAFVETAKRRHRICIGERPAAPVGLDAAIAEGAPRLSPTLGLWTQPGIFSWDRIDPGSALLAQHLPSLAGAGADLGCGLGYLAGTALKSAAITRLVLVDLDRRAIEAARRNVEDPRAQFLWADMRAPNPTLADLDFVVMNPPFHGGGREDRALGQAFIASAAAALKPRGVLWLVANRHLPYEASLATLFKDARLAAETGLYKVYEARK